MKNNTAYLKQIHWVLLLSVAYAITGIYFQPWLYELFRGENYSNPSGNTVYASIILSVINGGITYAGIGIATSKWRESIIAFILSEVIFIVFILTPGNFSGLKSILYFFTIPLPLTLFFALQTNWKKQLLIIYLAVLLGSLILTMSSFGELPILRMSSGFGRRHEIWGDILRIVYYIATKLFQVIFLCELLNYLHSDTKKPRTLLINLGNQYDKLNGFIAFWVMKTSMLLIAFGAASYIRVFLEGGSRKYSDDYQEFRKYYLIMGIISIAGAVLLILFIAWYLRRLLLEYFITYNVRSKFLYWLALIPFIGFLSFLFMETNQVKERNYNQKIDTMGNFAGSSTAAISSIAFIALFLRMVFRLSNTDPAIVLSVVIAAALFTWMIYSTVAYYLNLVVTLLALIAIIVISYITGYVKEEMIFLIALLLISLSQLVLFLPVYHFDKFLYTPAENPERVPEEAGTRDIFA
jgi:hypothetical protein